MYDAEDLPSLFDTSDLSEVGWSAPVDALLAGRGAPAGASLDFIVRTEPSDLAGPAVIGLAYQTGPVVAGVQNIRPGQTVTFRGMYKPGAVLEVATSGNYRISEVTAVPHARSFGADGPTPDDAIAEVRRAYAMGLAKLDLSQGGDTILQGVLTSTPLGLLFPQPAQVTGPHGAFAALGEQIDRWADSLEWAQSGKRPDGSAYSMPQWVAQGKTLLDAVKYQSGVAVDSSALNVVWNASSATAATVAAIPSQVASGVAAAANAAQKGAQALETPWPWVVAGLLAAGYVALKVLK